MSDIVINVDDPEVIITDEYSSQYDLPIASSVTLGGVKIGNNVNIASDGKISVPIASTGTAGVIKVGANLSIDANGVLSGQAGGSVTIDSALSTVSTNPVQNRVITNALNSATGDISTIQGDIITINGDIGDVEESISSVSETVTNQGLAITALQTDVETNTNNISTNTGNIATNTSDIADLDDRLDTVEDNVTDLGNTIGAMGALVDELSTSTYNNKKLSIYGDSISTFAGYIPTGNATYYTGNNAGVSSVDDTWWKKVVDALGLDLLVNNSWSGRAVSSIRDSESGHTTDAGYKQANINVLGSEGTPEVIIIKLGINDFNQGALLGNYDGSTSLPSDPTKFTDAYAMMLDRIMTAYPLAEVYCCTLMQCERTGGVGFPEVNSNGDSLIDWNDAIRKLAEAFGCKVLNHASCGITYYNLSEYTGDYDSGTGKGLHPNADGMSLIANQTIHEMDNTIRIRY